MAAEPLEIGMAAKAVQLASKYDKHANSRLAASAALFAGAVAMGASPIFVRLADVGPFASAFWRVALAIPFLWAWVIAEEGPSSKPFRWEPTGIEVRGFCSIALAGAFFAGDLFFWHLAILNTTVANATFLATMSPVVVIGGAWIVLKERVNANTLLGLVLCLAGAGTLLGSSYSAAPDRIIGDAFGLATAIFFGGYVLAMSAARRRLGGARLTFLATVVTAAVLLVVVLLLEDRILPRSLEGLLLLVCLALVSQVGGQGLLAVALGHFPAGFSSLVIFLEAIAAMAFGWIFLAETPGFLQLLGGILILAGIYAARPRRAVTCDPT